MGSYSTLRFEKFSLDWGKNNLFINHSCLFIQSDIKQIPYYYAFGHEEVKKGFSATLFEVLPRLELLGYSQSNVKEKYELYKKDMKKKQTK